MSEEYNWWENLNMSIIELAEDAEELYLRDPQTEESTALMQNLILAHIALRLCNLNEKLDKLIERQQES